MATLPEKLSHLRRHYQISQNTLAQLLNIDVLEYMAIENGRSMVNYEQLETLAQYFRIDVAELFCNDLELTLRPFDPDSTDRLNFEFFARKEKISFLKKYRYHILIAGAAVLVLLIALASGFRKDESPAFVLTSDPQGMLSVSSTSVVYIDSNGAVRGSGDNSNGQLNNLPSSSAVAVAEGEGYTLVLLEDGHIESISLLSRFSDELSSLSKIVSLASGSNHALTLDSEGRVNAVGDNSYGQCSLSGLEAKRIFALDKASVLLLKDGGVEIAGDLLGSASIRKMTDIIDIDSSDNITVVLHENGTVDYFAKRDHFAKAYTYSDIVDVACGNDFIALLDKNGSVAILVDNNQIADEVALWRNITAISAGNDYLIGFDGSMIFGTGLNSYNQFTPSVKEVTVLAPVSNIKISSLKDSVEVRFSGVANASDYQITLDQGMGYSYLTSNEFFSLPADDLNEGQTYTVSIKAIGRGDYSDSMSVSVDFVYSYHDEKDDHKDDVIVEMPFPVYHLVGRSKEEFEEYLRSYDFPEASLVPVEDEDLCEASRALITMVSGYEDGEKITKSNFLQRTVEYHYCRLENIDEEE